MSINKFSNIAKNTAAGTFAILNNGSDASGYNTTFTASGIATFNSFSYKLTYDPLWRRVILYGDGGHMDPADTGKFVAYELDYDRWSLLPYTPYTVAGNRHMYGLLANISKPGVNQFFRIGGNDNLIHAWNTDFANPQNIAYLGTATQPPPIPTSGGVARGGLEYFPERDELIYLFDGGGEVRRKPFASGSWSAFFSNAVLVNDGVGMGYNPVSKVVVWGQGQWWKYDVAGTITPLDNYPGARGYLRFGGEGFTALMAADPGSGKFVFVTTEDLSSAVVQMWELDPLAATGAQWQRLSSAIEAAWPAFPYGGDVVRDMSCVAIPEHNVILFSAYNSTWLYKHSAGLSFTQKAGIKGVLSTHPFTSQSELKYTWQNAGSPDLAPLENYLKTLGSGIGYDYPWPFSNDRTPGEGNTSCTQQIEGALGVPIIDGANGLRFQLPSRSFEQNGNYNANFDDVLHAAGDATEVAINPSSPKGRVIFIQLKVKADAAFWATQYRQYDPFAVDDNGISNPGLQGMSCLAGSDILAVPPTAGYSTFSAVYVGKELLILSGGYGGWVGGYYHFTQYIDPQHMRLDRSPCPVTAGYWPYVRIEGTIDHGFGAPKILNGGVKLCIITGNPPEYGNPSLVATLKHSNPAIYNTYAKAPLMVQGGQGAGGYGAFNDVLFWNESDFNELTIRIEVGQTYPSTTGWRATWWLNGAKDDPKTDWYVGNGFGGPTGSWTAGPPAIGFGWFQISIQMTGLDPLQVTPLANVWVKDVIISTTPIQMNTAAVTVAPDIPAAPCLPWFLRA
jgi:hypothetical protein